MQKLNIYFGFVPFLIHTQRRELHPKSKITPSFSLCCHENEFQQLTESIWIVFQSIPSLTLPKILQQCYYPGEKKTCKGQAALTNGKSHPQDSSMMILPLKQTHRKL